MRSLRLVGLLGVLLGLPAWSQTGSGPERQRSPLAVWNELFGGPEGALRFGRSADGARRRWEAQGVDAFEGLGSRPPVLPAYRAPARAASQTPPSPDPAEVDRLIACEPAAGPKEKAFFHAALVELQKSAEGREVLAGLIAEYKTAGKTVTVSFTDISGSVIVDEGNHQDIAGGYRMVSQSSNGSVTLNRKLLALRDAHESEVGAASSLAHEFNHLRRDALVKRVLPEYSPVYYSDDLTDELGARLKGWIVNEELDPGRATYNTSEIRGFLDSSPQAYEDILKVSYEGYARRLDLKEMRRPLEALEGRLDALKRNKEYWVGKQAEVGKTLFALEHMQKVHFLAEAAGLHDEAVNDASKYAAYLRNNADSVQAVNDRLATLQNGDGPALLAKLKKAAADPAYKKLVDDEVEADAKRLKDIVARHPLPADEKPVRPGKLTWEKFWELVAQDKKDHPDHWKGSR